MRHVPVLLNEVIGSLDLKSGMKVVDCTLGDGGHSEKILEATSPSGKLLGIDADPESLLRAKNFLHQYTDRAIFVRENFLHLKDILEREKFAPIDAILIDLGWSTPQFAERGRGFSFQNPSEPLDMRYDKRKECDYDKPENHGHIYHGQCTAAQIINDDSEKELERIFRVYGEEKLSKEIAKTIVEKRKEYEIETVGDLVNIILEVYRKKLKTDKEVPWVGGLHPATKVFQALRISVNEELTVLEKVLPQAVEVLKPGGRLAVISFHSLEDKLVKHYFKSKQGKTLEILTKKPIVASEEEASVNAPSRSAKLRVVQKI